MRKFLRIILNLVFKMQQKAYELPKGNLYSYSNGTSSSHITSFATMSLDAKNQKKSQKKNLEQNLKQKLTKFVLENIYVKTKLDIFYFLRYNRYI